MKFLLMFLLGLLFHLRANSVDSFVLVTPFAAFAPTKSIGIISNAHHDRTHGGNMHFKPRMAMHHKIFEIINHGPTPFIKLCLLANNEDHVDGDTAISSTTLDPFLLIPIILPFAAYSSFDSVEAAYTAFFKLLASGSNFQAVDGGALQARIISPILNGIVLPTSSLLFSTLVSNTVGTLRNRLNAIKECLTQEAGDVQKLMLLMAYYPSNVKMETELYLIQYCTRLIAESQDSYDHEDFTGSADTEINQLMVMLNDLSESRSLTRASPARTILSATLKGTTTNSDDEQLALSSSILTQSFTAIDNLNSNRLMRMTQLRAPYPFLHYAILIALPITIIFSFLMQTTNGECRVELIPLHCTIHMLSEDALCIATMTMLTAHRSSFFARSLLQQTFFSTWTKSNSKFYGQCYLGHCHFWDWLSMVSGAPLISDCKGFMCRGRRFDTVFKDDIQYIVLCTFLLAYYAFTHLWLTLYLCLPQTRLEWTLSWFL